MVASGIMAHIAINTNTLGFWTASIGIPVVLSLMWLVPLVLAQNIYYTLCTRTSRKEHAKKMLASIEQFEAERKAGDEAFEKAAREYNEKRKGQTIKE